MSEPDSCERRFIAAVDAVELGSRDVGRAMDALHEWLGALSSSLGAGQLRHTGLCEAHPLAVEAAAIDVMMRESVESWSRQWADLQPAQVLADAFDDKVILLVFGKFNAGKSSFCNFLADRFAANGRPVRLFRIEAGRLEDLSGDFAEGTTETTTQLHGVFLGHRLVLLDTPGLHSMTLENAALTKRYTDSADGVLWLTNSTSPGQVQELDELARELRRGKPLLPVLTRSDVIDEDEIDGEIRKFLRNKSDANRELQEADVGARAAENLALMGVARIALLSPVSISVHAAREGGATYQALAEAGVDRLYEALLGIVEPALRYKQQQPALMLLHHLEENVQGRLVSTILPRVSGLVSGLRSERGQLEQRKSQIAGRVWRRVVPALPDLLDKHAGAGDRPALCREVSRHLLDAFDHQVTQDLAGYAVVLSESVANDVSVSLASRIRGGDDGSLYQLLELELQSCLEWLLNAALAQCAAQADTFVEAAQEIVDGLYAQIGWLHEIKSGLTETR